MELRRELRSSKGNPADSDESRRAPGAAPGKSNRAHRAYAGVPAPAGAQELDWGATLNATRGDSDAMAGSGAAADGPGYDLSRIEGDIAMAEDLLSQVQVVAVPAYHLAVAALDPPAVIQLAQAIVGGVAAALRQVKDAPTRLALADPHGQL